MIVIDFQLWSAISGKKSSLGLILIDNQRQYREGNKTFADYQVRAYPKGVTLAAIIKGAKPHRHAMVLRHPKHSKSVWNLLHKALKELGYED